MDFDRHLEYFTKYWFGPTHGWPLRCLQPQWPHVKGIGCEKCLSDPCVLRFMMNEVVGMVVINLEVILFAGTNVLAVM